MLLASPPPSLALPSPYTANAVASFAFDEPVAVLDTNVGRVLSRALALRSLQAREAQALATRLLPRSGVAGFNQTMLDLGAQYCGRVPKCAACPVRSACRFWREGGEDPAPGSAGVSRPQARFAGSDRQVRGRVLRALHDGPLDRGALLARLADIDEARLGALLETLVGEGLVGRRRQSYVLGGQSGDSR